MIVRSSIVMPSMWLSEMPSGEWLPRKSRTVCVRALAADRDALLVRHDERGGELERAGAELDGVAGVGGEERDQRLRLLVGAVLDEPGHAAAADRRMRRAAARSWP